MSYQFLTHLKKAYIPLMLIKLGGVEILTRGSWKRSSKSFFYAILPSKLKKLVIDINV